MLKEFRYRIKVNSQIKPLSRKDRVIPELILGQKYYVSFGTNWVYPCFLSEIINEFEKQEVRVKIQVTEKNAYFRKDGKMTYDPFEERLVYSDEIGGTPEDAVRNAV